jgi:hypothetical protein
LEARNLDRLGVIADEAHEFLGASREASFSGLAPEIAQNQHAQGMRRTGSYVAKHAT